MNVRILGISGSLRPGSSNNSIIKVVASMMPPGVEFKIYNGIGTLPHFDDNPVIPPAVSAFQQQLKEADGVFICSPEYAFGVPGSLKNALDWTVGSGEFVGKPVALVTASSQGNRAHAALLETLTAISANIVEGATLLVSFIRAKLNDRGEITDPALFASLQSVVNNLVNAIEHTKSESD